MISTASASWWIKLDKHKMKKPMITHFGAPSLHEAAITL